MSAIEKINELKKVYETAVAELGGQLVQEALKPLWEAEPKLEWVEWNQYTPYFNDGDPCTFHANEIHAIGVGGQEFDQDDDWEAFDQLIYVDPSVRWDARVDTKLGEALQLADRALQGNYKVLETVFGDHCTVRVHRDGKAVVEEYDHD